MHICLSTTGKNDDNTSIVGSALLQYFAMVEKFTVEAFPASTAPCA